jgi:hypothetical protein
MTALLRLLEGFGPGVNTAADLAPPITVRLGLLEVAGCDAAGGLLITGTRTLELERTVMSCGTLVTGWFVVVIGPACASNADICAAPSIILSFELGNTVCGVCLPCEYTTYAASRPSANITVRI